jgi:hypothetical protein
MNRHAQSEFFIVGHDEARSQFDGSLLEAQDDMTAFMFCGIGDARHLFATIAHIAHHEKKGPATTEKRYHFTILDLKPTVLVRDLIMLFFLEEIRTASDSATELELFSAFLYTYASPIMPAYSFVKLQSIIKSLVEALQGSRSMPTWIYLPESILQCFLAVLKGWTADDGKAEVENAWTTSKLRSAAVFQNLRWRMQSQMNFMNLGRELSEKLGPNGCEEEEELFEQTGLVRPPTALLAAHEPELATLLAGYIPKGEYSKSTKITEYIDTHWKPNVTNIDTEWLQDNVAVKEPDVGYNPYGFGSQLFSESEEEPPKNPSGLFDYFKSFFTSVVGGLRALEGRFVIEFVHGEMADVLERLRYNVLEQRNSVSEQNPGPDPKSFPIRYDRIHLSNIPDYIGGALASFIYGLPILKNVRDSTFTSICLGNPPKFESLNHFLNEYALINTSDQGFKIFGMSMSEDSPLVKHLSQGLEITYPLGPDYISWCRALRGRIKFDDLLPRAEIERWLYAHFFKLVLPYPRPRKEYAPVHAPLNLTIFFRLLVQLHDVGYPGHWLSSVLVNILRDEVTTTARPPRSSPLTIKEASQPNSSRQMSTAPFVAEMSSLARLWLRLLPFGCPGLPLVPRVFKYSITFPEFYCVDLFTPQFMLLFWNRKYGKAPKEMRSVLLDDEKGSPKFSRIRRHAVHIVTTFTWTQHTRTAGWTMRGDVVENMKQGEWDAYIWRTNDWMRLTKGTDVRKSIHSGGGC